MAAGEIIGKKRPAEPHRLRPSRSLRQRRPPPAVTWKQKESRVVGGVMSNLAEGIAPDRPIVHGNADLPTPPLCQEVLLPPLAGRFFTTSERRGAMLRIPSIP
jgi:hypothetical protein